MSDIHIGGDLNASNANIGGTQTFHGPVYFGSTGVIEPAPKRENRIFLSYARKDDPNDYADEDTSFMRKLYRDLTAAGFDVWWDQEKMATRELKEIRDAISSCRMMVLVVGENAVISDYVEAEWKYALSRCIPVVPILRNGDYELLPPELLDINAIDFRDDNEYLLRIKVLQRILDDPDAPLGTLYGVPALPGSYIEREALAEVRAKLLVDTHQPLVVSSAKQQANVVTGLGGIGKTTLASALSRDCEVRRAFPDGIFWIEIGQTPQLVTRMADIGAVFGDPREEYPDTVRGRQRLSALLRDKRVLLVLDDVWEHQHAQDFRVADTNSRLLITTRQSGMLVKLDAQGQTLGTLTQAEGLALIAERLSIITKRMTVEGLPPECVQMIEILSGHTLAVSLAAAQLSKRGVGYAADLLRRLKEGKVFGILQLDKSDKNLNLELTLKLSYDDLADLHHELQQRFRATGIFAPDSSFDIAMAQAIWGDKDVDETDDRLTDLVDVGLLQRDGERYTQHDLLRAYARALLLSEDQVEITFDRYADYIIAEAEHFQSLPLEIWGRLDPLLSHVQEVGDRLVQLWETSTEPQSNILSKRSGQFTWNTMPYVKYRPQMIVFQGRSEMRGLRWLEMGLSIYQNEENLHREITTLNTIGIIWDALGEKRKALEFHERALSISRTANNQSLEATSLHNIGTIWDALDEKRKALEYYEQALELSRNASVHSLTAAVLNSLGDVWRTIPRKALEFYEQALSIYSDVSDTVGEAITLNNLGSIWDVLGEKRKALEHYNSALQIFTLLGDKRNEANVLNNMGLTQAALNETRDALSNYEKALTLRRIVGDRGGEANTLARLGMIWNSLGEINRALEYLLQATPLYRTVGDRAGEMTTLNTIASIYRERDDLANWVDTVEQIIIVTQMRGSVAEEATFTTDLALTLKSLGQHTKAKEKLEKAVKVLRSHGLSYDLSGQSVELLEALLMEWQAQQ